MCSTPTTIGSTIWSSRCVSQLGLPILISLLSLLSFVSLQSARVSQAVYSVPWYEGGTHFRKTLLIFLMQTQMPLVVSLGHRRGAQGSLWLPFSCGMHFIWQILILPLCMRSISSLVSVCFAPLADKSRQRLPHDFGHVSESVECILFVLYHVAWRDQQMSWKPKLFGHATCPKTVAREAVGDGAGETKGGAGEGEAGDVCGTGAGAIWVMQKVVVPLVAAAAAVGGGSICICYSFA